MSKDLKSSLAVKNHSLCGILRTYIQKGEEKTLTVKIPGKAFIVYDEDGQIKVDSDNFMLYAGLSQPDKVSLSLGAAKPVEIALTIA